MNSKHFRTFLLICGALSAIAPFSIDMYLPGFPHIAQDLRTDIAHVTLSLTSFFVGISLGQLFYGPALDRFGRKKPVMIGLAIYMLAAIGCGLATSVQWLIAFRFLMAIGGCAGMVAVRAIVRDLFPVNEIAKTLSLLMLVMGAAPIVAPTIGGYVVTTMGWRGIFLLLVLWAIWLLFLVFRVLSLPSAYCPLPSAHCLLSPTPVSILARLAHTHPSVDSLFRRDDT